MAGPAMGLSWFANAANSINTYQNLKGEASAYEANANILEGNATQAASESALAQDKHAKGARQQLSAQRAAQGQAGVNGGTALESYLQSFANAAQDNLDIGYRGANESINYLNQARLARYYGKTARANASNSAFSTAIGGAANTLSLGSNYFGGINAK